MYIQKITFPKTKENSRLYPENILSRLGRNEFPINSSITLIYGSNGSGKSTVLNLIAQKLQCVREVEFDPAPVYNKEDGELLPAHRALANRTTISEKRALPEKRFLITGAEVLEQVALKRYQNKELYKEIEDAFQRIDQWKWRDENGEISEGEAYLKEMIEKDRYYKIKTSEKRIGSNGEEMLEYFNERLEKNGVYLLDEPENCLSPIYQKRLAEYIFHLAQNENCQFLIASHSPFFLSMKGAQIINIDTIPASDCENWVELDNMQPYFDLFEK